MAKKHNVQALKIDADLQRQWHNMACELAEAKKKAAIALDLKRQAEIRAHDLKLRCKSAEGSLKELGPDAHRYRWMKKNGCEYTLGLLRRWEVDMWDEMIDKQLRKL